MSDAVLMKVDGNVGVITLNRPEKFNCISKSLVAGLNTAINTLQANPEVRVLLLHGAGKVFCTGADPKEILETRESQSELHAMLTDLLEVLRRFERGPLPVIAAVHGLALAGGLEMMMGCDVVFAAKSAKIGDQHAQYGLVPGGGNSQRLTRVLGRRRALDLMFSARWLGANEALEWGLVNYVVDDEVLLDEAMAYARKVASHSATGLATMKLMVDDGIDMSQDQGLAYEVDLAVAGLRTADSDEGLNAFRERRTPEFAKRTV